MAFQAPARLGSDAYVTVRETGPIVCETWAHVKCSLFGNFQASRTFALVTDEIHATAERGKMTISSSIAPSSSISSSIAPHLPYLRRFARAVSGSQTSGDAYALATLEAIVADTHSLRKDLEPRVALYQVFLRVWGSVAFSAEQGTDVESRLQPVDPANVGVQGGLQRLESL